MLSLSTLALELTEQVTGSDQMVVEDLTRGIQQRANERIANGIADADALLAAKHDLAGRGEHAVGGGARAVGLKPPPPTWTNRPSVSPPVALPLARFTKGTNGFVTMA